MRPPSNRSASPPTPRLVRLGVEQSRQFAFRRDARVDYKAVERFVAAAKAAFCRSRAPRRREPRGRHQPAAARAVDPAAATRLGLVRR